MELNKSRIIAIVGTIIIHVSIFFISFFYSIDNSITELFAEEWPPRDSSEILFGGEYVMIGDAIETMTEDVENPDQSSSEDADIEPSIEAEDMADNGAIDTPPQPVTSTEESNMPIKENPTPSTPGPTKEPEKTEPNNPPAAQQQDNKSTMKEVKFNTPGSGSSNNGGNNPGQKDGNSNNSGKLIGNSGDYNIPGYSIAHWVKPQKRFNKPGSVTVAVTVSKSGKVLSANVVGGTPALINNDEIRKACEVAAKGCSFKVNLATAKDKQRGTITYKIE